MVFSFEYEIVNEKCWWLDTGSEREGVACILYLILLKASSLLQSFLSSCGSNYIRYLILSQYRTPYFSALFPIS